MTTVDSTLRAKVKSSVSRSIPRLPGKALVKHRRNHETEHLLIMKWMELEPFLGYKKVSVYSDWFFFFRVLDAKRIVVDFI